MDRKRQRIVDLSLETFGNEQKSLRWLHRKNAIIWNDRPISPWALLETDEGRKAVEERLIQIQHGLYP